VKILVVTNMLPTPSRPWHGIFVKEQIDDLRGLGLDVSVLFLDTAASRVNFARGIAGLRGALDRLRPDLVHAHYGLTGAVAVTQRHVPVVTTFHGSDANGSIPWQKAVSWVVARVSTPVVVSLELARSLGVLEATVVPAAVDLDVFQPMPRHEARRALGWPDEGYVALLPGSRRHRAKGADLFDATLRKARALVPALRGVSLEGLTRAEVALTMNAVDVTVMTSISEGSPVAVKESLACQTPVVSVPVGDVEHLLEGLPKCAVVPRDPEHIAAAVVEALHSDGSPALRERASAYSRPLMAQRVLDVYQATLRARRT
jgi:teichuronic acid biosynthesis glycosyltransferase TuaC